MLRKILENHPEIIEKLDPVWIDSFDDAVVERRKRRRLTNILDHQPEKTERMLFALRELIAKKARLKDTLVALKSDDGFAANSAARELETYGALRQKKLNVEWQPTPKGKRGPDLRLEYLRKTVFLEIRTVHPSKEDNEQEQALGELRFRLDALEDNPFVVRLDVDGRFTLYTLDFCFPMLAEELGNAFKTGVDRVYKNYRVPQKEGPDTVVRFRCVRGIQQGRKAITVAFMALSTVMTLFG